MIVVDTNIISYLLIPGSLNDRVEKVVRKDSEWAAPVLWRSEFCSVLLKYLRNGTLDLDEASAMISKAQLLITPNEVEVSCRRVLDLAVSSGCSAYDCEFVCAAEQLGVPLVTSDNKLLGAFPGIAFSIEAFVSS